jgi:hypothetical protein
MDLLLIGLLIVFVLALVLCLTYAYTLVNAVVLDVLPEGIFTWLVNFYDGSPIAWAVAIVRILIAIAVVYYLLKYLTDKDDNGVLRATVVLSSIASVLSSFVVFSFAFKGGLDLALGMAQIEFDIALAFLAIAVWFLIILPVLTYIKAVWLLEKVADGIDYVMGKLEILWQKNTFYIRQVIISIGVLVAIFFLLLVGAKVGEHISQTKVEKQEIQRVEFQSDLFQMQRGDEWCRIPLYGLSEQDYLDFVSNGMIFKSCDIAENHEVIVYTNDWGVIYIRLPSNYIMEVGDIFCRNSNQYFPDDCSITGDYLWLQVGFVTN